MAPQKKRTLNLTALQKNVTVSQRDGDCVKSRDDNGYKVLCDA